MIDILLATFNGEKYIEEQLLSIINQSIKDWRLLIRDDNSSDQTIEIIKRYSQNDHRIVLLNDSKGNLGIIKNFEELLFQSTGEYIMFADQDDVWLPTKIQDSLNAMYEMESLYPNQPILIHTDVAVVDSSLQVLSCSFIEKCRYDVTITQSPYRLAVVNCVMGCTILMNKISKKNVLPFNNYVLMHDWWIALNISHFGKIFFLNKATSYYRQHQNNQIGAKSLSRNYYIKRLFEWRDYLKVNYCFLRMIYLLPFKMNLFRVIFLKICNTSINFFTFSLKK